MGLEGMAHVSMLGEPREVPFSLLIVSWTLSGLSLQASLWPRRVKALSAHEITFSFFALFWVKRLKGNTTAPVLGGVSTTIGLFTLLGVWSTLTKPLHQK